MGAINAFGEMALSCDIEDGGSRAALWSGGMVIDLGTIPGEQRSWGFGISSSGQVVGRVDMGTYGHCSDVTDIEEVVRYILDPDNLYRPFHYSQSTGMTELESLGRYHGYARALTPGGLIIGYVANRHGSTQACYWQQEGGEWLLHVLDLEVPLPPGWQIRSVVDVTPDGQAAVNLNTPEDGGRAAILTMAGPL